MNSPFRDTSTPVRLRPRGTKSSGPRITNGITINSRTLTFKSGYGLRFIGGVQELGGSGEIVIERNTGSAGQTSGIGGTGDLTIGEGITVRTRTVGRPEPRPREV